MKRWREILFFLTYSLYKIKLFRWTLFPMSFTVFHKLMTLTLSNLIFGTVRYLRNLTMYCLPFMDKLQKISIKKSLVKPDSYLDKMSQWKTSFLIETGAKILTSSWMVIRVDRRFDIPPYDRENIDLWQNKNHSHCNYKVTRSFELLVLQ